MGLSTLLQLVVIIGSALPFLAIAFTCSTPSRPSLLAFATTTTRLQAEGGGAPQYEKRNAILRQAETVADGTVVLHIAAPDEDKDDDEDGAWDYQPGHVLALEIENPGTEMDEKTAADAKNNGGWVRGPYTVSRSSEKSMDILIRVVGDKSKAFASAEPGTPLKFGGKFKVPITEGISDNAKRVVLISTGVGIGPCIGAIEKFMSDESFTAKIDLYASFRTSADVPYREYLDGLAADESNNFGWMPIITSDVGRIASSDDNMRMITQDNDDVCSVSQTHYHLIGNGQMVNEWKLGLLEAGVQEECITLEAYFNHQAETSQETIKRIGNVISSASLIPAAA